MQDGRPSETAEMAAMLRTAHAEVIDGPAIHRDPYAAPLAGLTEVEPRLATMREFGFPKVESVAAHFALRQRLADESLLAAVDRGARQVVILGAGLDSFGLRYPEVAASVEVVEVDHPATQQWKRARLDDLDLDAPRVRYVAVDFEEEDLAERLSAEGVGEEGVACSWLGVSPYVGSEATEATFRLVAGWGPGSEIVFDYGLPVDELQGEDRTITEMTAAIAAGRGEPFVSFWNTGDLVDALTAAGFERVEPLSIEHLTAEYFQGQPDHVRPLHCWRLMRAGR